MPGSPNSTNCSSTRKKTSSRCSRVEHISPTRYATPSPTADQGGGDGRARYAAIITDGNGRWAQRRGLPVIAGHEAGADVVKARLRDAADLGVDELTVYSFSTENWSRDEAEVAGLMEMFGRRI